MKITAIKIYRRQRKVKIVFSTKEEMTWTKFGKILYCGQDYPSWLKKSDPTLLRLKNKLERLDYVENSSSDINLSEIYAAQKECKQFINKTVETCI